MLFKKDQILTLQSKLKLLYLPAVKRMKKKLLFFALASITLTFYTQVNEVGLTFGGTKFVGDIGNETYFLPNKTAGAIFYKYNYNPRIALKATYSFLPIAGNDLDANNTFRQQRKISFTNTIHEFAAGIEFNFYEFDLSSEGKTATPYLLLELAAFSYTNVASYTSAGEINYGKETSYAIPFGIGYKSKLYGTLAIAFEAKFRYTFKDDLDFTSIKTPNANLEGTGNDWYFFSGISLIYTFGRPSCYTKGL